MYRRAAGRIVRSDPFSIESESVESICLRLPRALSRLSILFSLSRLRSSWRSRLPFRAVAKIKPPIVDYEDPSNLEAEDRPARFCHLLKPLPIPRPLSIFGGSCPASPTNPDGGLPARYFRRFVASSRDVDREPIRMSPRLISRTITRDCPPCRARPLFLSLSLFLSPPLRAHCPHHCVLF